MKDSERSPSLRPQDNSGHPRTHNRPSLLQTTRGIIWEKARALGTTRIPHRGRGVDLEGKDVPVFIGPQGGKEKGEIRGFPDLNNVYSQEMVWEGYKETV